MRLSTRIGLFFIIISFLLSCGNKKNNCSEILQKVIKTPICNEMIRISTDSNYSENLCNKSNSIDSNFRNDSTFFGYFILNRYNENCSSDSLKSWRFNARYKDSIYSENKFKVYEGDLIYSNIKGPSNSFTVNNNFNSDYNFVGVRQIVVEDIFEIYYFFKLKKSGIEHNRIMTFGFNN